MRTRLALVLLLAACGEKSGNGAQPPLPEAPSPPGREEWWNRATTLAAGGERVLCPRELRDLLAEGKRLGFDQDGEWWGRRGAWASERILSFDPEDAEANALAGRRSLQSIPGFDALWKRMAEARAPTPEITEMLDEFGPSVDDGHPVFLARGEFEIASARLKEFATYLDRLDQEPAYEAEQRLLTRVRASAHAKYPFVHARAGPFLVFYTARDLMRDPEGDAAAEEQRIAGCREVHLKRLQEWTAVYQDLVDDLKTLYPETFAAHALTPAQVFPQWVFREPEWYEDFGKRVRRDDHEPTYRRGFFESASGWAYLLEPSDEEGKTAFRETAAYLAAVQILRAWARDEKDPTTNRWDVSEAYWFKEGLPSFLASRRVPQPIEGQVFLVKWDMPSLATVVQRRGPLEHEVYLSREEQPAPLEDGGYTDLAWLLVRHLNGAERRPAFEKFLRSQIEGGGKGIEWFEECFGVKGTEGWDELQRATYASIE